MLSWLYGESYTTAKPIDQDARVFALEACRVADKYQLVTLAAEVQAHLIKLVAECPAKDLIPVIAKVYDEQSCEPMAQALHTRCAASAFELARCVEDVEILERHPTRAVEIIKALASATIGEAVERKLVRWSCGHTKICKSSTSTTSLRCANVNCKCGPGGITYEGPLWMKKDGIQYLR